MRRFLASDTGTGREQGTFEVTSWWQKCKWNYIYYDVQVWTWRESFVWTQKHCCHGRRSTSWAVWFWWKNRYVREWKRWKGSAYCNWSCSYYPWRIAECYIYRIYRYTDFSQRQKYSWSFWWLYRCLWYDTGGGRRCYSPGLLWKPSCSFEVGWEHISINWFHLRCLRAAVRRTNNRKE